MNGLLDRAIQEIRASGTAMALWMQWITSMVVGLLNLGTKRASWTVTAPAAGPAAPNTFQDVDFPSVDLVTPSGITRTGAGAYRCDSPGTWLIVTSVAVISAVGVTGVETIVKVNATTLRGDDINGLADPFTYTSKISTMARLLPNDVVKVQVATLGAGGSTISGNSTLTFVEFIKLSD